MPDRATTAGKPRPEAAACLEGVAWIFDDTYTILGEKHKVTSVTAGEQGSVSVRLCSQESGQTFLVSPEIFAELEPDG